MRILLIALLFTGFVMCFGVFDDYEPSARTRALGGISSTISTDANASFYNPAGLTLGKNEVIIGYTSLYSHGVTDFNKLMNAAFSLKLPGKFGFLGLGIQSFSVQYQDVDLVSEKTYALSHSFNLIKDVHSSINMGYTLNMYHLSYDDDSDLGEEATFGITAGSDITFHERTKIGFYFTNINSPDLGREDQHELPRKMVIGLSYLPYNDVITMFDIEKKVNEQTELHSGIEVTLLELLKLRTGLRSNPVSFSGGLGIDHFNITVDYGFNTHSELGLTHQVNIGYHLK